MALDGASGAMSKSTDESGGSRSRLDREGARAQMGYQEGKSDDAGPRRHMCPQCGRRESKPLGRHKAPRWSEHNNLEACPGEASVQLPDLLLDLIGAVHELGFEWADIDDDLDDDETIEYEFEVAAIRRLIRATEALGLY